MARTRGMTDEKSHDELVKSAQDKIQIELVKLRKAGLTQQQLKALLNSCYNVLMV